MIFTNFSYGIFTRTNDSSQATDSEICLDLEKYIQEHWRKHDDGYYILESKRNPQNIPLAPPHFPLEISHPRTGAGNNYPSFK